MKAGRTTRCAQSCPTGAMSLSQVEDAELQEMIKTQKLEVSSRNTKPRRLFTIKTLAILPDVLSEAVSRCGWTAKMSVSRAGCRLTLFDANGGKIGDIFTDNYGDFKFDNLAENSGKYKIQITLKGYNVKTIEVELKKSVNAGVIWL